MRRLKQKYTLPGLIICLSGLIALWALFALWLGKSDYSLPACLAALVSTALFAAVCLNFVPGWMRFWSREGRAAPAAARGEPPGIRLKIFGALLLCCILIQAIIYAIFVISGRGSGWRAFMDFWECLDSGHYVDIARDWYLSEGSRDRLVQLVFLPGYPIVMRLAGYVFGDLVFSGIFVSIISFSAAGCVFYSLLRLDSGHGVSLRALCLLCLMPGSFFFVAPMSESLFLLLSVSCVYLTRRGKILPACLCGAYAAFTRSLGLMLFVPVCMELLHKIINAPRGEKRPLRLLPLLLIPAGFGAYIYINYLVSGNPFQYMIYQKEHWGQSLGLFFNTAAYQTENVLACAGGNIHNLIGLWLPNLAFSFAALALMIPGARRMRPSYAAWFIAYYFVAIGATWLLSAPRYIISLPPFILAAALAARTPRRSAALVAALAPLWAVYAAAFVLRWQVW